MNGDGNINAVGSNASTTYFDFNGDNISERSGWISPQDGMLALDSNGNGAIDGLNELFGTNQIDGFTELAGHDSNADGVIDAQDDEFTLLRVWQDANQDGISQAAELKSLDELGITAINLANTPANITVANNLVTATGSFVRNGATYLAADINLAVNFTLTDSNPNRPLDQAPALDSDVYQLPWLRGYGNVKSLHIAYQEDPALSQAASDLIAQGATGILQNFDTFMAQWTGLEAAHQAKGVTRTNLTAEDKMWMLETLTGQDMQKSAIEAAGFGVLAGRITNTAYIDGQWTAFTQRESISFAIQATGQDWNRGAYYSLAGDRFVVTDAAMLQSSLVQGLSTISNREDVIFAAVTLDRLRSDGCDLQATTLKPALAALPGALMYEAAIDGRLAYLAVAGTVSVPDAQDWWVAGSEGNDALYGNAGNDIMEGGAGNDTLAGIGGNDTLDGGTGNDYLSGGDGNDTYLFNLGGGQDTIAEYEYIAGSVDIIRFGAGIAANDITFTRSGMDLVLGINGTSDQLTIRSWGDGDAYRIQRVEFADGTAWDAAQIQSLIPAVSSGTDGSEDLYVWAGESATLHGLGGDDYLQGLGGNDTLDGGIGNDSLQGGAGDDTYLFNVSGGQDTIYDHDSTGGNVDTIRFGAGIAPGDITFMRHDYDLVLSINDPLTGQALDQLTLQNWGGGDEYRIERFEFADLPGTVWDAANDVMFEMRRAGC